MIGLQPDWLHYFRLGCQQHAILQQRSARTQRLFGCHPCDFRMIVVLGQVRQYDVSCTSIIVPGEEICESFVGEMTHAAHHPLFHRPWVRTAAQHFEIVVGLEQHYIASAKLIAHARWNVAEVGGDRDFYALAAESKTNGIGSVM